MDKGSGGRWVSEVFTEDRESCCRVSVQAASLQCYRRCRGPYVQEGWVAPPWGRQGDDPFDQVSLEAFAFLHNLSICCMINWNHKGPGLVRQSWLDDGRVRLGPFKIQAEESLSFSLCSGLGIAAVQPPLLGDHGGPGCVGTAAAWEPWAVWALRAYGCGWRGNSQARLPSAVFTPITALRLVACPFARVGTWFQSPHYSLSACRGLPDGGKAGGKFTRSVYNTLPLW